MLKTLLSVVGVYRVYEKWLRYQVKNGNKPEHIAIILDGNRRWALGQMFSNPWIGHQFGASKVEDLLEWCLDLKVKSITLYAFSTENFQRPSQEVEQIMQIASEKLHKILSDERIHRNRVRVKVIGRVGLLPKSIQELILSVEESTKDYNEHFLNIAFAYGGRAEIVDAIKRIVNDFKEGKLTEEDLTEDNFINFLYSPFIPDVDLLIRTSGEERISNFLLWRLAYSELYFAQMYWPAVRRIDIWRALRSYERRARRFGS